MGTKIIKTTEVIKVCPNQEKHIEALVDEIKAKPCASLSSRLFTPRHNKKVFCEQCGATLINQTIKHENVVCDNCGEDIYPSDSYCPHCGDKIR